jgi:hypothetical protein
MSFDRHQADRNRGEIRIPIANRVSRRTRHAGLAGTPDTSLAADISGFGDFGHALAIDSQGRIVAAGSGFELMRAFL